MISQTDIDDWKDEDFVAVVDDIPEDKQKFKFEETEEGVVLDMKDFLSAYGRALYARFKLTVSR